MQVWLYWACRDSLLASTPYSMFDTCLALAVFLLLLALILPKQIKAQAANTVDAISAMLLCIGPFCAFLFPSIVLVIGLVLGALGIAWMYIRWGMVFARLDIREALKCIFLVYAFASAAEALLVFLPSGVQCFLVILVSILGGYFLVCSSRSKVQHPVEARHMTVGPKELILLFAIVTCCTIVGTSIRGLIGTTTVEISTGLFVVERLVEVACFALLLYLVFAMHVSIGFSQIWSFALFFLSLAIIVFVFDGPDAAVLVSDGVGVKMVIAYYWLTLVDVSHSYRLATTRLFAFGWICYALPRALARYATVGLLASGVSSQIIGDSLVALLMFTMLLITWSDSNYTHKMFSDLDPSMLAPEDFANIDQRCEAVADQAGLTSRELEVMKLLCKGRSKTYIAESLFITENTVRVHARHIYSKLEVHNKEELQKLIGV